MNEQYTLAHEQQELPVDEMLRYLSASVEDRNTQRDQEFGGEEWNPDDLTESNRQEGFRAISEALAFLSKPNSGFNSEYVQGENMRKVIMALHVERQCPRVIFSPIGQQTNGPLIGIKLLERGNEDFLLGYDGKDTLLYKLSKGDYVTY